MKKVFRYIEHVWLGPDGKPSVRRSLALVFSIDLIMNITHVITQWGSDKSYSEAAILLGLETGLIAALLSLSTYSALNHKPKDPPKQDEE